MFLGHTNPKLWVFDLCKLAELRKNELKVEISHDLIEICKEFLNFIWC